MSNLNSVLLARYHFFPEVKKKGMVVLPELAMLTSSHVRTSLDCLPFNSHTIKNNDA